MMPEERTDSLLLDHLHLTPDEKIEDVRWIGVVMVSLLGQDDRITVEKLDLLRKKIPQMSGKESAMEIVETFN